MLTVLLLWTIGAALDTTFVIERQWLIPERARVSAVLPWTFYSFWTANSDGSKAAFIDTQNNEVCMLDLTNKTLSVVASHTDRMTHVSLGETKEVESLDPDTLIKRIVPHGVNSGQVNLPVAVVWGSDGSLYVSDAGSRRVSVFDGDGQLRFSFLLNSGMDAPWDFDLLNSDTLLLSSLIMREPRGINAGYFCNVVSQSGRWVRAFAYTPEVAFTDNLWTGVWTSSETDDEGNTYVTFSVDPAILVFDRNGNLVRTFGENPEWWIAPLPLSPLPGHASEEPPLISWTRVVKLVRLIDGRLIRVAEANGWVPGCNARFVMDIFSSDGRLLRRSIYTDYWPVGVGSDGSVFLLSVTGDQLVKAACVTGGTQ